MLPKRLSTHFVKKYKLHQVTKHINGLTYAQDQIINETLKPRYLYEPDSAFVTQRVTSYIKVYGDVLQIWVMFSHLLIFISVINARF